MLKRLFTITTAFQILSLLGFVILLILLARVLHHQTDDVFIPFWDYISSFQIAFPPILILIATYGLAFVAGKKLSDVPSDTVSFLRNKFFQSWNMMGSFIAATIAVSFYGLYQTENTVPPHYERLVSAILSGEIDRSEEAKKLLSVVSSKNPKFADQLLLVQQVFELRRQRNLEANTNNLVKSRLLVRALNNSVDQNWVNHPLRKHALAEAHSLLAEAIGAPNSLKSDYGIFEPDDLFDEAILLFSNVRDNSSGRTVTSQLSASAQNNIGNVHWYRGHYQKALEEWQKTIDLHPLHKNVGTLANMVAANIALGNHDEGVRVGTDARNWAEKNGKAIQDTAHYVSILVHTGFALVAKGEVEASIELFQFAALIENDDNTKINLALSYAMLNRPIAAEKILRQVSSPVTHRDISGEKNLSAEKRCSYLWWALHSNKTDPRDIAARLMVFLGEKHSEAEMQKYLSNSKILKLRNRVADELGKFPGSCNTYSLMKPIVKFVRGG